MINKIVGQIFKSINRENHFKIVLKRTFFRDFIYLFLERGKEREREGNISVQ